MEWWVYPEGLTGQAFSLVTGKFTKYGIVQSATKPPNAVAGPFATAAEAQADASSRTSSAIPGPATPQAALKDAGSALSSLNPLAPIFQANLWLRVGEFIIGLLLVGVGLAKLTGAENFITSAAKKVPIPL